MLTCIDISNWQKGLNIPESIDGCIIKATEGVTFVDKCCDGFVTQCKAKGLLWGFYHFMTSADPEKQAIFFAENTQGYSGFGIPVLDIESSQISNWGDSAQRFVDKYHAITGVYPMIYASASALGRFKGYPLVDECGLWVAGYPNDNEYQLPKPTPPKFAYDVSPWKFAAMWQYSAKGILGGWQDFIDVDVAFMDYDAWKLYADPNNVNHGKTTEFPNVTVPSDNKSWTFENSKIRVDVTLK